MKTSEVLNKAADLLEPRGAWTQRCSARDAAGEEINAHSKEAVSFCAFGAINRIAKGVDYSDAVITLENYLGTFASTWTDKPSRRKGQVIAALRAAAAEASK